MLKHYLQTALRNLWRFKFTTAANVLCLAFGFTCFMCAYLTVSWLTAGDPRFSDVRHTYAIGNGSLALFENLKADYQKIPMTAYFLARSEVGGSDSVNGKSVTALVTDSEFFNLYRFAAVNGSVSLTKPDDVLISKTLSDTLFSGGSAVGRQLLLGSGVGARVVGVYQDLTDPCALSISRIETSGVQSAKSTPQVVMLNALAEKLGLDDRLIPDVELPDSLTNSDWLDGRVIYFSLPKGSLVTSMEVGQRSRAYLDKFAANANPDVTLINVGQLVAQVRNDMFSKQVDVSSPAGMLLIIGVIVVCVAIANYANLYTTQALSRTKDNGLRQLLGATRSQMFSYCLLDVFLMCLLAMLIAVALLPLCSWALRLSQFGLNLAQRMQLDWNAIINVRFFVDSLCLLVAVTVLSAVYPVYVLNQVRPMNAIRQISVTQGGLLSRVLVGLQFMTASALLIGLIVMQWQHRELRRAALGDHGDQLVILNNVVLNGVPTVRAGPAPIDGTFETVKTELLRHKGILGVSWTGRSLWEAGNTFFGAKRASSEEALIPYNVFLVSDNFPEMMGFKLKAGRWLDPALDSQILDSFRNQKPGAPGNRAFTLPVLNVLVDVDLMNKLGWSDPGQVIGKQIVGRPINGIFITRGPAGAAMGNRTPDNPYRIVGVVDGPPLTTSGSDTKLFQLAATRMDMIGIRAPLYAVIRIDEHDISGGIAAIKDTIRKLAPGVVPDFSFADQVFGNAFARYQFITNAVMVLAMIAFAISIMSMVGMAAHALNRRRHEVGVRKSLGASNWQIFGMIFKDFSSPVIVANVLAWPIGYVAMSAYLNIFSYRISLSIWFFVASLVITVAIAWLSVSVQTLRAARLRPAEVLRYE